MTTDLGIVLALLLATIGMFALNRPRMDAVALLMVVALPLSGVIGVDAALAGFSDPNVILIAALFVVGEALVRTGVAQRVGDLLMRSAGASEARLIVLLMVLVAGIGAFMSSTGVVAIFIPIVLRIAAHSGIPAGRLMMPLSVAALISGMMTLVATAPNLVIDSLLRREGLAGFGFFAFTPFGVPVLALAIGWMLIARRWLARGAVAAPGGRPRLADWIDAYGLADREFRIRIGAGSALAGRRLDQLSLRATEGVNILGVERRAGYGQRLIHPAADTVLQPGDVLFLDVIGKDADVDRICASLDLTRLPMSGRYFSDHAQDIGMVELMLPPDSPLVGQSPVAVRFRSVFGLAIVGMRRDNRPVEGPVAEVPMRVGDILLAVGPWKAIRNLTRRRDLIVLNLPAELDEVIEAPGRALPAVAILAGVVVLMVSGVVPNVLAALAGCLALGLFGCIDMAGAYRAIHWQTLVLIVGMLPFSAALQATGGVALAADGMMWLIGAAGPRTALAAVFVLTVVMGLFISNTATAVLVGPVALAVAAELGVSPWPFAMTVALAASSAFLTPVSSPVNMLVVGPGNYRFADFLRVGLPLAVVVLAAAVALVPLVFPFGA